MSYDYTEKRIIAVINEELPAGLAMNALGHLAFSAGHYSDSNWLGKAKITDVDGNVHRGISKYPFIVLKTNSDEIKKVITAARKEGIFFVDYPQEMFDTGLDDELVLALEKAKEPELKYHAIVLVGDTKILKSLTGHLKLYR